MGLQQIPHIWKRVYDAILVFGSEWKEEEVQWSVAPVFEVFLWFICKFTYLFFVSIILGCVQNFVNTFYGVKILMTVCYEVARSVVSSHDLFRVRVICFEFTRSVSGSHDLFRVHTICLEFTWSVSGSLDLFRVHMICFKFIWSVLSSHNNIFWNCI